MMAKLRLILGDQLNEQHSWYTTPESDCIYLMAEMLQETNYVKHHIQKVVAFFLSMRNFSEGLQSKGHQVKYYTINDRENLQDLGKIINQCINQFGIKKFEYQLPDEYCSISRHSVLEVGHTNFSESMKPKVLTPARLISSMT